MQCKHAKSLTIAAGLPCKPEVVRLPHDLLDIEDAVNMKHIQEYNMLCGCYGTQL
jgi:hypothetical protein